MKTCSGSLAWLPVKPWAAIAAVALAVPALIIASAHVLAVTQ
jgi:hypothetical protein